MDVSLYDYLIDHWSQDLTPLFCTLETTRLVNRTAFAIAEEVAPGAVVAIQAPALLPPYPQERQVRTLMENGRQLYWFEPAPATFPVDMPPHVICTLLSSQSALSQEWVGIVYAPTLTFLFCARGITRPEAGAWPTHFSLLWSANPEIVAAALTHLHGVADALHDCALPPLQLPPFTVDLRQMERFYQRFSTSIAGAGERQPYTAFENADICYILNVESDTSLHLNSITRSIEALLGYTPQEMLGMEWGALYVPTTSESAMPWQTALRTAVPIQRETQWYTRQGHPVWMAEYILPEWSEREQRVVRLHGALRDITEVKTVTQQITYSEANYHHLFENAPVMLALTESRDGEPYLANCNEMFCTTLGYERNEIIGRPLTDIYSAASRANLAKDGLYRQVLQGDTVDLERELVTKDGRLIPTQLKSVPRHDSNGEVVGTQSVFVDMRERRRTEALLKQTNIELEHRIAERTASLEIANRVLNLKLGEIEHAQAELQTSQQRLQDFFESTTELVMITDEAHHFLYTNPAWRTTFGYSWEDLQTLAWDDIFHPDDITQVLEQFADAYRRNLPSFRVECRFVKRTGEILICEGNVTYRFDNNGLAEAQMIFRDITERKAEEARRREEEARYRFVVSSLPHTVLAVFDRNLRYTLASGTALEFVGLSREAMEGKEIYEVLSTAEIELLKPFYEKALQGESTTLTADFRGRTFEIHIDPYWEADEITGGILSAFDFTEKITFEQERREQEQRYRLVVQNIPNTAVLLFDPTLTVTLAEGPALAPFGVSGGQLETHDFVALSSPEMRNLLVPALQNALQGQHERLEFEFRDQVFDIQILPVELDDAVLGCLLIAQDITARKREEYIRQEQEERYRLVVRSIPNTGILLFDRDMVFTLSEGEVLIYGALGANQIEGRRLQDVVIESYRAEAKAMFQKTLDGSFSHFEFPYEGKVFDIQMLPVEVSGKISGGMLVLQDITQRKEAERQLQESEARYRLVAQNMPESAVFLFDKEMRFSLAAGPALARSAFGDQSLEGHLLATIVSPTSYEKLAPIYEAALRGERISVDVPADGRVHNVRGMPVEVNGEIVGGLILSQDITERKATEEALRQAKEVAEAATRAKSTFLANMSHEIRTPLNAMMGALSLLFNTDLTSTQKDYAAIVRLSTDSLLALISDILDFSKIEADKLTLDEKPFDLRTCIEDSLDLIYPQTATKHLEVAYRMDTAVPERVIGDKHRIRQILVNLLTNAVKFTTHGEVQMLISVRSIDANVVTVTFAIRDTGIGLSREQHDLIFDAFTQGDPSSTRRYGGSGLGLTICKRLTMLMGGTITVESTPAVGSTFYVTLPLRLAEEQAAPFPQQEVPALAGKRVLVIVPNNSTRQLIAEQVRMWGMRSLVAALEQTALAFVRQSAIPFDVIIWDDLSPEQGDSSLSTILRVRGAQQNIPIVRLTRQSRSNQETILSKESVLTKPLKPGRLYEALMVLFRTPLTPVQSFLAPHLFDTTLAQRYPLRILLAEDNLVNQRVTLAILEQLGYEVNCVADGREAVLALNGHVYDVILMDIQMPVMSGVEATQHIRAQETTLHQPYIIALTANAMHGDRELYLSVGMNAYLSKPLDIADLQTALRQAAIQKSAPLPQAPITLQPVPVLARSNLTKQYMLLSGEHRERLIAQLDSFVNETPTRVQTIQNAMSVPRLDIVLKRLHTLKIISLSFSGMAFVARCETIESHINAGRITEASMDVARLSDEAQILIAALLAWRRETLRSSDTLNT